MKILLIRFLIILIKLAITVKERKEKILNNMVLINFKQLFEYEGDKVKVKQ